MLRDPLFRNSSKLFIHTSTIVETSTAKDTLTENSENNDYLQDMLYSSSKQNILINPWKAEELGDYYDDVEIDYADYQLYPVNDNDYLITSGTSLQKSYQVSPSLSTSTLFQRKLDDKSPALLPPSHGINGLDLILSGGQPTTFQNYIRRKIYMDMERGENYGFVGNTKEEKDQGTWAGSSEWVRHWVH